MKRSGQLPPSSWLIASCESMGNPTTVDNEWWCCRISNSQEPWLTTVNPLSSPSWIRLPIIQHAFPLWNHSSVRKPLLVSASMAYSSARQPLLIPISMASFSLQIIKMHYTIVDDVINIVR